MTNVSSAVEAPHLVLIGAGAIARRFYRPALERLEHDLGKLTIVDRDKARAERFALGFVGADVETDYRAIVTTADGAIVALPNHLHHPVASDFLSEGVPVLCEKPLDLEYQRASDLVQTAREAGVALLVNNTRRLFPSFKHVRESIRSGEIGRPEEVRWEEGEKLDWPSQSGFFFSPEERKGVMVDRGAHVFDLLNWWFEGSLELTSCRDDSRGGIDAVAEVDLRIGSSVGARVRFSWLSRLNNRCVVRGTDGTLSFEPYNWREIVLEGPAGGERTIGCPSDATNYSDFGVRLLENFLGVIQGREDPLIRGEDVLGSIRFLEQCYADRERLELPWLEVPDSLAD